MRYKIIAVGRRTSSPLADAADDYIKRLGRYGGGELVRVREVRGGGETDIRAQEYKLISNKLDEKLGGNAPLIALDERGESLPTAELSRRISTWQDAGVRELTMVIGGADGLDARLLSRARQTWSLSKLTLPHRLALVVLSEQLYRAETILRGEPYHRA